MSSIDEPAAVPKTEPFDDLDEFSDSDQEPDGQNHTQEVAQVQKRKGGRKPIYATSEERKQRNRQAQAAFRERRTEYIKQLETTIKHHEDTLQSLQQSHRSAADECLMLRYKNSLLERILLEKGIDVQAELRVKTEGSHVLSHPAANSQSTAVQRAVMNRHHQNRRAMSGPVSKSMRPQQPQPPPPSRSQSLQTGPPVPSKSPHGQAKPGAVDGKGPQRPQPAIQPRTHPQQNMNHNIPRSNAGLHAVTPTTPDGNSRNEHGGNIVGQPSLYGPEYQAHLDQLEQEYESRADLLEEETESESPAAPGSAGPLPAPYPHNYSQPPVPPGTAVPMGMQSAAPVHPLQQMSHPPNSTHPADPNNPYGMVNMNFDPYDPSLDADPFGLTASMHFPTQFTYQENAARR